MIQVMGLNVTDKIFWSDEIVLTTRQLALFYGCSAEQIVQNFNANKERFVEGKHYFVLTGEALRLFKGQIDSIDDPLKFASCLYLWTKRGCARHAKMLKNDKAWEVFEALEDAYFSVKPTDNFSLTEKVNLLMRLIQITPDDAQKVALINQAALLLTQN